LVFAFMTVVVGSEKCNWVEWLQRGDEEVEVVGVEGMEKEKVKRGSSWWGGVRGRRKGWRRKAQGYAGVGAWGQVMDD
jgi:hypothetical protein